MKYIIEEAVQIPMYDIQVTGDLHIPEEAKGIVVFSHGSGSSRLSPRNRFVASKFENKKLGTLLFDLLTEEEDQIYENRFNINLLMQRLLKVTKWLQNQKEIRELSIGYFGASTGAASALMAAAELGEDIKAVVSRGGRPDLAIPVMPKVKAPTLLIIGSLDYGVIELNQEAFDTLKTIKKLAVVTGATHLFEEEGKLEEVANLATDWFNLYLE